MSQLLFENIVVGVRWETLLGLESEKTEIRQLAAETQAQHFVVVDNGMQTRSVGLTAIPSLAPLAQNSAPALDSIERLPAHTEKSSWLQKFKPKPKVPSNTPAQLYYPLAALFCLYQGRPERLFLHAMPNSETHAIMIAVRDNRPVIDVVLPWLEVYQKAQQFFESCQKNVDLIGEAWLNPVFNDEAEKETISVDFIKAQMAIKPLPLAQLVALNKSSEGAACVFQIIREPVPIQKIALAAAAILGFFIVIYSGYAIYAWLTKPAPKAQPAAPDLLTIFKKDQQMALEKEALNAGLNYARQVYQRLTPLPVNARGWHPSKIVCEKSSCVLSWERGDGGTFNSVLALRGNAVVESMNEAKEIIEIKPYRHTHNQVKELTDLPIEQADKQADKRSAAAATATAAPLEAGASTSPPLIAAAAKPEGGPEVHPIPAEQFYRTAGARLQTLKDFQMEVTIELPQPLVPFPDALADQKNQVKPISKGIWKLQGKLGFLDSVPGLLGYAPNVSLERLEITVDPSNPTFNAQGAFYVE